MSTGSSVAPSIVTSPPPPPPAPEGVSALGRPTTKDTQPVRQRASASGRTGPSRRRRSMVPGSPPEGRRKPAAPSARQIAGVAALEETGAEGADQFEARGVEVREDLVVDAVLEQE